SEAILSLKPVTFHYKSDKTNTPQFGLIAEEVAEVSPDLVVRNDKGDIYTVRYDAVNAMLLNEFLKEHKTFLQEQRKVEELKTTVAIQTAAIAELESTVAEQQRRTDVLTAQQKEQAAQLQKVSATLKESKPTCELAFN